MFEKESSAKTPEQRLQDCAKVIADLRNEREDILSTAIGALGDIARGICECRSSDDMKDCINEYFEYFNNKLRSRT